MWGACNELCYQEIFILFTIYEWWLQVISKSNNHCKPEKWIQRDLWHLKWWNELLCEVWWHHDYKDRSFYVIRNNGMGKFDNNYIEWWQLIEFQSSKIILPWDTNYIEIYWYDNALSIFSGSNLGSTHLPWDMWFTSLMMAVGPIDEGA